MHNHSDSINITYSIGVRYAGGGIGNIAHKDVEGLLANKFNVSLLCDSAAQVPDKLTSFNQLGVPGRLMRRVAMYDTSGQVNHFHTRLFDRWSVNKLKDSDIFLVWGGYGKQAIEKARRMGAVVVLQWASSHPTYRYRVLGDAYEQVGQTFQWSETARARALAELDSADYVLVPSEFVKETFLAEGFPAGKLLMIPFGVDSSRFKPAQSEPAERPFRLLFVGQVGIRKGIPALLEAWKSLDWQEAELCLVGRVQNDSEAVLNPYRSLPGVRWIGHVHDPVALFQSGDVFVFPTLEEGSALVTYEAMACGLPVVTTAEAGSLVTHGKEGLIIEPNNVAGLANALNQLYEDRGICKTLGQNARNTITPYTWSLRGREMSRHLHGYLSS